MIANIVLTLDGRISGPDGPYDMRHIAPHGASPQGRAALSMMTRATTAILGRVNYEGFQGYWPAVAADPTADPRDREFARWLNSVEKLVFTHQAGPLAWSSSIAVASAPVEVVRTLRKHGTGDIRVLSSASLITELLAGDEIDVLEITFAPVIAGEGRQLFTRPLPATEWALSRPPVITDTDAIQARYTRTRR
ncbi:dihydrofolate reductase family protein [Dermacoccus sp. PAMC28757]|uniref:dihydrofolate reductase family protein n=1 Tax=Dermacoccus sp. PAMC28757 TaxID=2762331 RepID=UPI00164E78FA|nr:dihydrofolate reductase family protein [Dermacoccus sp. PAMC28757]QNK53388.1 dihydrofolate reductase family protein [Dermacoccus sp. PAMC28757]